MAETPKHGYHSTVTTATSTSQPTSALETTANTLAKTEVTATTTPPKSLTKQSLTNQQLVTLLGGLPNGVAEQIFKLVDGQVNAETGRQQRIDAKATALLTAVGLSLTVAFTFGAVLLKDGWTYWKTAGMHAGVVIIFALALLAGFTAAIYAIRALLVRSYPGMNEDAIFNEAILNQVRNVAKDTEALPGEDAEKLAAAEASALAQYQMSMTMQLWAMVQGLRRNHAVKAPRVRRGQFALIAFLVLVGILFVFLGYAAYFAHAANA